MVRTACGTSPATLADHIVNESTLDPTSREFQKGRTFRDLLGFPANNAGKEDRCFGNGRRDRLQSDRKAILAECFKSDFIYNHKDAKKGGIAVESWCDGRIHNTYILRNFLPAEEN